MTVFDPDWENRRQPLPNIPSAAESTCLRRMRFVSRMVKFCPGSLVGRDDAALAEVGQFRGVDVGPFGQHLDRVLAE